MSLSDLLVDYGGSGNSQFDDHVKKQFTGPAKFATKIDPLQVLDNTIKPPSLTSFHKETDNIHPSPNSGMIQFSPKTSINEEKNLMNPQNKEQLKDFVQTNLINQQKEGINNFIKLVLAKSYFNRFVENMLQKSYVKKLSHFNLYQNTMMDDLRYIDSKHKIHKNLIGKICKKLRFVPILDQSSYLVIGWQLLHILTIIIVFFWTPFNISFGITFDQVVFGTLTVREVEYYFLFSIVVDAFIVINTSYIEKGIIIKQRGKIFINYVNTQGIYDLCSFASMLVAQQFNVDSSNEKIGWQLIPYMIYYCSRQFKLQARVHKLEEFFNFSGWVQDLIELIKLLFMVVYVGHLFACLWHGVAFYQIGIRKTWLETYDVANSDIFTKYNYAFYWSVQTMITVGYGDLTPQNNYERLCANLSMFLACGVFAFSFNSIGLMLSNLNSRQVLYKRSTNLLNSYLTKNQIKVELQSRIRNYYDYIFQEEQEINDEEVSQITTKLSSSLQEELNFEIRFNVMKTNKVLTKFSQKTLRQLSLVIEEVRYSPEDQILLQGTQDDCSLYIITKGTISVLFQDDPQGRNTRVLSYLEKGESFGEYSFFTGLNRCASAKSIGFSRAYKIPRQSLLTVLQTNQIDLERFCEVRDSILLGENYQPAKLSCYSCKKFNHLIKDCPVLHYVADKERVIKKENYPFQQDRNVVYKRKRSDRNYYATLLEMKKTIAYVRDFQTRENQADNITVIDEDLDVSYEDNDGSPNEQDYTSLSKSYSKVSRQHSQNRSYSQYENNNNNKNLQPIQESDDSIDSPSPNKRRNMQVKQTLQTAGFGAQDSFQNKIRNDDFDPNISSFGNATPSIKDENRFTTKNDSLCLPGPIDVPGRVTKKRITLVRKQKREESYKPFSSQTKVDVNQEREKSQTRKSKIKDPFVDIPVTPSIQSVDHKRDSVDRINDHRDQKRKSTKTKTNRSRTAKTHKTTKLIPETPTQEISIPVFERQPVSMELEDFEVLKNFSNYFSWNNAKVVVARTMRVLLKNLEKRRYYLNQFSFYTFNSLAITKITRIKRKLKLIDDPPQDEKRDKKNIHPLNKTMKGRRESKRSTQTDDISGLFQKKPQFGTQVQLLQGISFSRFSRIESDLR
ncbi:unnamed protein product (macronuclear) [Paramecium tetraurelia]|uniref:Cyclic nucleotide-binding domain-containing protein n=1 Tax=Paramecium tetraurelia TaxID=5888 RepID=A0BHQ4_PARTE|nr:uncharacterized protein GSPATT00029107001 [Paramecium tetraurelia]CAK58071.1 unnamed protein product [Paramecium tetraurelia]|eukprot:XP_001425469.1 hypothetical protein (macronuclear) [Paramecium tetraurelia strain d4-2]